MSPRSRRLSLKTLVNCVLFLAAWLLASLDVGHSPLATAQSFTLPEFRTVQLSDVYYSEGACAGDLNGDDQPDVVCGPYWYEGPELKVRHEIYAPVPQDRNRYADNFFSWIHDFDGDGFGDVLVVGFPGTPAYVYENPGRTSAESSKPEQHWKKHEVLDWVSNESPQWIDLVGDESPELVCTRDGFFGFATFSTEDPFGTWSFHPISEPTAPKRFGHGLGVGDVDGDGRRDILFSGGWFEQPDEAVLTGRWRLHSVSFSNAYGGADMHAYDVDGDGDNDVITSHAAHDFGLGWYEQVRNGDDISFEHHLIMGDRPENNRYGVVFSELHSVNLTDVDGDGLKDIVTGKTYWSHHRQSPMWNADAVVYWFRLVRTNDGVDWVVVGGMKGAHVLLQSRQSVDKETWQARQPKPFTAPAERTDRGSTPSFSGDRIADAIEAESMVINKLSKGQARVQDMSTFKSGRWSAGKQLFWMGAEPGATMSLGFDVAADGQYRVGVVMTTARDYGIIRLALDGRMLGEKIDLYDYPDVGTTGELDFGVHSLKSGKHELTIDIVDANDSAVPSYMFGIDCLRFRPQ